MQINLLGQTTEDPRMKTIPLTQGKVALVDDEDYSELSKHRWYANKFRNTYYAVRNLPTNLESHKNMSQLMHIAIVGTPRGMQTDHINGNGLDNRRCNLRVVTHRQNLQNRHVPKTSKYPGVSWDKPHHRWRTDFQFDGKKHYLGQYKDEQTAAIVYIIACETLKFWQEKKRKEMEEKQNGMQ